MKGQPIMWRRIIAERNFGKVQACCVEGESLLVKRARSQDGGLGVFSACQRRGFPQVSMAKAAVLPWRNGAMHRVTGVRQEWRGSIQQGSGPTQVPVKPGPATGSRFGQG